MKKIFLAFFLFVSLGFCALAQQGPTQQGAVGSLGSSVQWLTTYKDLGKGLYEIIYTAKIAKGWHIYGLKDEYNATSFTYTASKDYELVGKAYELSKPSSLDGEEVFFNKLQIGQKVRLLSKDVTIKLNVVWRACTNQACGSPEDKDLSISFGNNQVAAPQAQDQAQDQAQNQAQDQAQDQAQNQAQEKLSSSTMTKLSPSTLKANSNKTQSLWSLILEAILWAFAMILTPCVFPMIPMTVSYFMKGSSSPRMARLKAFTYGFFIVLLYTLPICIIIGITWILGGNTVTADIFNWLATNWIPNLIFFVVFIVFAASFFGAFDISLPTSIVNSSDKNADKKGIIGIFFMALTLVLISFSCTGPIVGSVLIKSTQGQFWTPIVTMLAFSIAFALPFTIFALFPSLLSKLRSGSWMNSVKVVLGFLELALALKFLSIPDLTYHWHILDREIYLAIWIVIFTLLGFYLLGKISFAHDEKVEKIGIVRLALSITVFSFVVYMIPGMWGAPLKALSGYLPPLETQDFVVYNHEDNIASSSNSIFSIQHNPKQKYNIKLPNGLVGYFTLAEGLEAAKKVNKPVFVDISGHGCTNCREMEARVWSDPRVLSMLKNDFVIVALYTDDKTTMLKEDWVKDEKGRILKEMGRVNSYIVRTKFGVNAQPNYVILDTNGKILEPARAYNLNIEEYIKFLQRGIDAFNAEQNK